MIHLIGLDMNGHPYDENFTTCCGINWRSLLARGDKLTAIPNDADCPGPERVTITINATDAEVVARKIVDLINRYLRKRGGGVIS